MKAAVRRGAEALLRRRQVERAVLAGAGRAGRGLVLVYHRVRPAPARPHEVVPCVAVELFRRQLAALVDAGDVVPLHVLRGGGRSGRLRFALTFDDDDRSHVEHVLPVLVEFGLPATFFLCGRALHSVGPYWWEVLERRLAVDGPAATAVALGLATTDPAGIALACEADPRLHERLGVGVQVSGSHLGAGDVAELAAAGMEVGFHTVDHQVLPRLPPEERQVALRRGRAELAEAAGAPLRYFAYPHGKADAATAADCRAAGFAAAWTGMPSPLRVGDDPHLLGRWEPGPVDPDTLVRRAAIRAWRAGPRRHG